MRTLCSTLLLWFLLAFVSAQQPISIQPFSSVENRTLDLEMALTAGSIEYEKMRHHPRKKLVCVTFANAESKKFHKILARNIARSEGACDWAVIFYGGSDASVRNLCNNSGLQHRFVHCRRFVNHLNESYYKTLDDQNQKFVNKPLMFQDILSFLPQYERAFVMDSDMLVNDLKLNEVMSLMDQYPNVLLMKPLIDKGGTYDFARFKYWLGLPGDLMMAYIRPVEQGIFIADSNFLYWFIKDTLSFSMPAHLELGSDWGFDMVVCGAAAAYSKKVRGTQNYEDVCAVAVNVSRFGHVIHANEMFHQITVTHEFIAAGENTLTFYRHAFGDWYNATVACKTDSGESCASARRRQKRIKLKKQKKKKNKKKKKTEKQEEEKEEAKEEKEEETEEKEEEEEERTDRSR